MCIFISYGVDGIVRNRIFVGERFLQVGDGAGRPVQYVDARFGGNPKGLRFRPRLR